MAQLHTPTRGMVACVTSPSASAAPVPSPDGLMPSLAPGVLCGMCAAVAYGVGVRMGTGWMPLKPRRLAG
jgi:hypothetical protein